VHGLGAAPVAKLLKLYFTGYELFVFGAPVVNALAVVTGEFYESVLGHNDLKLANGLYPIRV
jgi:hypothetical protein